MNQRKSLLFVLLILCVLVLFAVRGGHQAQMEDREMRKVGTGKILPTRQPMTESPFIVDKIVKDSESFTIFDSVPDLKIEDPLFLNYRVMTVKPTNIRLNVSLNPSSSALRVFVYNSKMQMVKAQVLEGSVLQGFIDLQFENPDLYIIRFKGVFDGVGKIVAQAEVEAVEEKPPISNLVKNLEIQISSQQQQRFEQLREERRQVWNTRYPMSRWPSHARPKEEVLVRVRVAGEDWSIATMGIAGRNHQHASSGPLTSVRLRIVSGVLPYGLRDLRLYMLSSKTNGLDMIYESLLRDHGMSLPKQDWMAVTLNGQSVGLFELYEGLDGHFFEMAQIIEGPILGYDSDSLFADPYLSLFVAEDSSRMKTSDGPEIYSHIDFDKKICEPEFPMAVAFGNMFFGFHGFGQTDLKFHYNSRSHCFHPMVRDFNHGIVNYDPRQSSINRFSEALLSYTQMAPRWRPLTTNLSSFYMQRTASGERMDSSMFLWHATPQMLSYFESPKSFNKYQNYLRYWAADFQHKRITDRIQNFKRVARFLGIQGRVLRGAEQAMSVSSQYGAEGWQKYLYQLPNGSETDLKRFIEEASLGEVTVPLHDIQVKEWRDRLSLLIGEKSQRDDGSLETNLGKNIFGFLYRQEVADYAHMFFIGRGITGSIARNFTLLESQGVEFQPTHIKSFGSEVKNVARANFYMNRFQPGEKLDIYYFKIPKNSGYQYLIPQLGPGFSFLGPREIAIMPKSEPHPRFQKHESSLTKYFNIQNKSLKLRGGVEEILEPIEIPKDVVWEVKVPTVLQMNGDACIDVRGNIKIADGGSLYLKGGSSGWQGLHFNTREDIRLENLKISNMGTGDEFVHCLGEKYTGGFSIFDTNIVLKNIKIENSQVEDALHILKSTARVSNLEVAGSMIDAIDADFSYFAGEDVKLTDSGGDGLDVSGALVEVEKSVFSRNADKGVSIGENSLAKVNSSELSKNIYGIAVKDASQLWIEENEFSENQYSVGLYVKKPYYFEPKVVLDSRNTKDDLGDIK